MTEIRLDSSALQSLLWSVLIGAILHRGGHRLRGRGPASLRPPGIVVYAGVIGTILWLLGAVVNPNFADILRGGSQKRSHGGSAGGSSHEGSGEGIFDVRMDGQIFPMGVDEMRYFYDRQQRSVQLFQTRYNGTVRLLRFDEVQELFHDSLQHKAGGPEGLHMLNENNESVPVTARMLQFFHQLAEYQNNTHIHCHCRKDGKDLPSPRSFGELKEYFRKTQDQNVEIILVLDGEQEYKVTPRLLEYLDEIASHRHMFQAKLRGQSHLETLERLTDLYNRQLLHVFVDDGWIVANAAIVNHMKHMTQKYGSPMEVHLPEGWKRITDPIMERLEPSRRVPVAGYILAFTHLAGYCFHGFVSTPSAQLCLAHIPDTPNHWIIDALWPLEALPEGALRPMMALPAIQALWKTPQYDYYRDRFERNWFKVTSISVDRPVFEFYHHGNTFPDKMYINSLGKYMQATVELMDSIPFIDRMEKNEALKGMFPDACMKEDLVAAVRAMTDHAPMMFCRPTRRSQNADLAAPWILTGIGLCFNVDKMPIDCPPEDRRNTCRDAQLMYILPKTQLPPGFP